MFMHHFIPYKRNSLFIGRERILAELETFFGSDLLLALKIVVLTGMPGVGKAEIALEYAYRTLDQYRAVVWLDASGRWQLAKNIAQFLRACGFRIPSRSDDERVFQTFRVWLRRYQSPFLLVLDQNMDLSLLNDVLDDDMEGHALVTHSSFEATDEVKMVTVKPFDEQEGSLFLLRRAGLLAPNKRLEHISSAVRQAAYGIHEEFGGHPLALDQAGAYISESGKSLTEYLHLYRQDRRAFLDRRGTASLSHPFPAYPVIAAMRQGPAYPAQELLYLYLDNQLNCSDPSPRLPDTLSVSSFLRQKSLSDPSWLLEMRAILIQNFLLVPLEDAPGRWGIHPLVRTVMNEVRAYEKEQDRLNRLKEDLYEPLDLEEILQVLIEVRQMKERLVSMPRGDPESVKLSAAITTMVLRLQRAVLPVPRKKRDQAKARIEELYSTLAYGTNAPLLTASDEELRRHARELLTIMQYR